MQTQKDFPLDKKIFRMDILVSEDSIDQLNHTNNKVYLEWMEKAALEHSSALGWGMKEFFKLGSGFVVGAHYIEYLRATFLGDTLSMYTWVIGINDRVSFRRFSLMRDKKICMVGATRWAYIDYKTGRSMKIPPQVEEAYPMVRPDDPAFTEIGLNLKPDYPLTGFTVDWRDGLHTSNALKAGS